MTYEVRQATTDDAVPLGAMLHAFNEEFETPTPTSAEFAARFRTLLRLDDVIAVIAQANGADVGFALVTLRPTPYWDGPLAQLDELYVLPRERAHGIGTRILSQAVDIARRAGAREMHINVDEIDADTRRFYEHHGFTNLEPGRDYRMLCYIREF